MKFTSFRSAASVAGYAFFAGVVFGGTGTGIGAAMLGSAVFDDVATGTYYDAAIGEMYGDGIVKGYDGSNDFGPDDYVTRGQVAVMLQRFKDEINGESGDDDDSSSSRSRSSRSSSSSSSNEYNPKGAVRFTTNAFSISESQSRVTITVVRVGGNQGEVSVEYEASAGTASAGSDFEAVSGTLIFENDETSKTFDIALDDDNSSEGDETVILTLSSPENGVSMGAPATSTLTIKDNETSASSSSSSRNSSSSGENKNGTLSFSATTYMANETAGTITITVERTGGSSGTVGVKYATSNGRGQSNLDYTPASGTLSFSAGETSKTFTVAVLDDSSLNGNTTFNLALNSATGDADLGTSAAVVTIHDDENTNATFGSGSIKLDESSYTVSESDEKALITVQRVGGAEGTVTVNYATANGSATSGSDYTSTSGTLTFRPGETSKIITIPIVNDSSAENQDEFYFNLSSPSSNSALISPNSATIAIGS